ncbi:hypothetical protein D3C86_1881250 [compost metagenome]
MSVIDTDAPGLHLLISVDDQGFRQHKMQITALMFDLFFILNFVVNLGYRDGDKRPGKLLRPAGALP